MGRYTGPKLRKVRRFGEEFALLTDRSTAAKFVKSQRKQPPGAHGGKQSFRKYTGYGLQLREKQKAKIFYHVSESQMRHYYKLASNHAGSASDNFMQILESRLDNVIYRSGWANSHPQARQWLAHGQFSLNGHKITIPSILIKVGDKLELTAKSSRLKETIGAYATANKPVSWLRVDGHKFTIEVKDLPTRAEIDLPVDESLIIEFYSR